MYTDSIRSELIEIFNELNIEKYMNLIGLEATWAKNFRHLNSRVWPGTDSLMFMVIDEEKTKELQKDWQGYGAMTVAYSLVVIIIVLIAIIAKLYF